MERRFFVVLQYLIDTGLHSNVIWAWATMRLIFGIEYPEFSAKMSALAFTIAFSVTGLWTILVGWVRDNKSFGLSRIGKEVEMTVVIRGETFNLNTVCYLGLFISYTLLALAKHNHYLLFAFVLQWVSGFSTQITGLQLTMLYPDHSGLLIGLSTTGGTVSSTIPLLWYLLVSTNILTFSNIMIIWAALTLLSLVICVFISPWHNLKHFPRGETLKKLVAKELNVSVSRSNLNGPSVGSTGKLHLKTNIFTNNFQPWCST